MTSVSVPVATISTVFEPSSSSVKASEPALKTVAGGLRNGRRTIVTLYAKHFHIELRAKPDTMVYSKDHTYAEMATIMGVKNPVDWIGVFKATPRIAPRTLYHNDNETDHINVSWALTAEDDSPSFTIVLDKESPKCAECSGCANAKNDIAALKSVVADQCAEIELAKGVFARVQSELRQAKAERQSIQTCDPVHKARDQLFAELETVRKERGQIAAELESVRMDCERLRVELKHANNGELQQVKAERTKLFVELETVRKELDRELHGKDGMRGQRDKLQADLAQTEQKYRALVGHIDGIVLSAKSVLAMNK